MTDIREDITKTAKDAAYVAIGLGVMTFQRAQVRRRELVDLAKQQLPTLEAPLTEARSEINRRVKEFDGQVQGLVSKFEQRVQPVEQRLPAPAQAVIGQAREAGEQLRQYILSALAA
jgi:anion-transporting  ArsA/GET3 family ATPase